MRLRLTATIVCLLVCAPAGAGAPAADEVTRQLLRRPEIEAITLSPDGKLLAIARRAEKSTIVSIVRRGSNEIVRSVDPGKAGEITDLQWLDDKRLMVGAAVSDPDFGTPMYDSALAVIHADGKDIDNLPANFLATIDGDPEHLLVTNCQRGERDGCLLEVRRAELGRLAKLGELVVAAPSIHCRLLADRKGNVRFAVSDEDDGNTKTYVHLDDQAGWTLINDSAKTGLGMDPILITPDGAAAYVRSERHGGTDVVERYELATGKRTEVYHNPDSDPFSYVFSLDDRELLGAMFRPTDPETHLWKTGHPDLAAIQEIQDAFPGKLARVTSASDDGQTALVYVSSDRDPGAYYLFERDAHKATRLGRRFPWIDPAANGSQRSFELKSRDGLPLRGLLTIPPGGEGKPHAMVVLPHGGPVGVVDSWGYDTEAQILARHGYAVLQVNFRGSGYYGHDFVEASAKQWGGTMQDDVTDATLWAIKEGFATSDRICIYGASYGGYSAMMGAIREPALYRCAIGRSGVYDLAKLFKWGDVRRSDYGKAYLKWALGEDPADLAARSPSKQADRIRIPVFLAHGVLDDRADVKHAQALEAALKHNGKQVELVVFGRMGHSILLEDQKLDFYARLLQFLDANIGSATVAGAP